MRRLSAAAASGPPTAVAFPVAEHGLQACGLQQLRHTGSVVVARGLQSAGSAAPWHGGSSRTRARTRVPYVGRRTPNHCATREVPECCAFDVSCKVFLCCWLLKGCKTDNF